MVYAIYPTTCLTVITGHILPRWFGGVILIWEASLCRARIYSNEPKTN